MVASVASERAAKGRIRALEPVEAIRADFKARDNIVVARIEDGKGKEKGKESRERGRE